jgi:hypothetical protein
MAKPAFRRKKGLSVFKLAFDLTKKPVKCYTRNVTLYGAESRSEITRKFRNMVLEKDGEDRLDRSCEK